MSPKGRILSTVSTGRSTTKMSMLKTLFILERPVARIRVGLSHRILPNDQEKGYYLKEGKKKRGVDTMEQCDLGLIFARVTALMSTSAIKLNVMLKYELAVDPTSIFDEKSGEIRISTSKSQSPSQGRIRSG